MIMTAILEQGGRDSHSGQFPQPLARRGYTVAHRLPSAALGALLAAVVLSWKCPPQAQAQAVHIGVLSSRDADGQSHADSIRLAFLKHGGKVTAGDVEATIVPIYVDYTSPDEAATKAEELVTQHRIVLILGAVDSDSTENVVRVLREQLGDQRVPVITSLSTAPSLTDNRDPWFFRATADDRERMKKYASHITDGVAAPPYALLYDDHRFGLGLRDALKESLGSAAYAADIAWSELDHMSDDDLRARLQNGVRNIFVLGPTGRATEVAGRLVALGEFKFFFVGYDSTLLEKAPVGSYTIGEPAANLGDSCDLGQERNDVEELKSEFESQLNNRRQNFRLMSYEVARYVVPGAIDKAIRGYGQIPDDLANLRDAVRQALEEETFDSLTPWRKIQLGGGTLHQVPTAPIYNIERRFARKDKPPDPEWAKLQVSNTQVGLFEGPVMITLQPRLSRTEADLTLEVDRVGASVTPEMTQTLRLTNTTASISHPFVASWPGRFRITASPIATLPKEVYVDVSWRRNYVWSFFAALVGSLVAVLVGRSGSMRPPLRVAVGVIIGLGLTAFAFHRSLLPGLAFVPLPTFSDIPMLNAIASGIFGGFAGPEIVITPRK
jgi:hypothetical protein